MKAMAIAASVLFVAAGASVLVPQNTPIVPQAAIFHPQQAGGFVQTSPGAGATQIIHVQVSGTPNSGSFVFGQDPGASPTHISWRAEFMQGSPATIWCGWVTRDLASDSSVHWRGGVTYGTNGAPGGGAFSGYPDGAGGFIGNSIPLNGPDFNVTGTGQFVGNPAFGGGGNVTMTVSP